MEATGEGVRLRVWVKPRASRTRITGVRQGALEVAIGAPPVDGEANGELVRFLAKLLGVPRSSIALASGAASRQKTIAIAGIDDATLRRALVK